MPRYRSAAAILLAIMLLSLWGSAQAQDEANWMGLLPLIVKQEPAIPEPVILSEGPSPASLTAIPGDPVAIAGLENCYAIAYDFLRAEVDQDLIWLVVTCDEGLGNFTNRAYLAQVPHETGLAGATLLPVPLADPKSGFDEEFVRFIGSVKAEPVEGGWTILTALLNKVSENNSSLFLGFISEAEVDAYLNDGVPFEFDWGAESALIDSGTMLLLGHRPEAKLSVFQEDFYYLLIACGKDVEQTLDHSSCYHTVLVPKDTPLALETHIMVISRNENGTLNLLPEPWGAGDDIREEIDDANIDADEPTPPEYEVPFKGTYVGSSGRTNIWQGGGVCLPLQHAVCLVFDSKGPMRWHKDLKDIPQDIGYLAYAVAGPGLVAVNAGEIPIDVDYGTDPNVSDYTGGFTAVPYPRPVKDESGTITGYAIDMWSSTDYKIHSSPVTLTVGY